MWIEPASQTSFQDDNEIRTLRHLTREALSNWLGEFDWDIFATLTFRDAYTLVAAERALVRFIKRSTGEVASVKWLISPLGTFINSSVCSRPKVVAFCEYTGFTHRPHFHALLFGIKKSPTQLWQDWWHHYGAAKIAWYDPIGGANTYVTKYMTKSFDDYNWIIL